MIVGVDPGRTTAFAFLGGEGVELHTVKLNDQNYRDYWLRTAHILAFLLTGDTVVIETYKGMGFKTPKARGASMLSFETGRLVGTITSICWEQGAMVYWASSGDVRKWLCGDRGAGDSQVKAALAYKGQTLRSNVHTRDALALALYYKEELR